MSRKKDSSNMENPTLSHEPNANESVKFDGTKEPFLVHCGKCSHEWAAAYLPLPVAVFAKLGKSPCPMCGAKQVLIGVAPKTTPEGDPMAWLASGDTGISSETIFGVMTGQTMAMARRYGYCPPSDPADFGRCYRLLKVMPSWRARLPEVAVKFRAWKPLIEAWDELTALYEEEMSKDRAPKLYHRMQELRARNNEGD
jgi:hypothetical protein